MKRKLIFVLFAVGIMSGMLMVMSCGGGGGGGPSGAAPFGPMVMSSTSRQNSSHVTDGDWVAWVGYDRERVWHFDGAALTELTALLAGDDVLIKRMFFDGTYVVIVVYDRDIYKYYYVDMSASTPQAIFFKQSIKSVYNYDFKNGIFVWENNEDGDGEIYYIRLTATSPSTVKVTDNTVGDWEPHVDGSVIIWKRYSSWWGLHSLQKYDINSPGIGIVLFAGGNINKDTEVTFEDGVAVWSAVDVGDTEIFYVDLNTSTTVRQLTLNNLEDLNPATDSRFISWENVNGTTINVYYANLSISPVSSKLIDQYTGTPSSLIKTDAGRILWRARDGTVTNDYELFIYNHYDVTPSARQITFNQFFDDQPTDVEGDFVLHSQWDGVDNDVYLYDTSGGSTITSIRLTNNSINERSRTINFGNVTWVEEVGNSNKLYFYSISSGASTLLSTAEVQGHRVNYLQAGNGDVAWMTKGVENKIFARRAGSSAAPIVIDPPSSGSVSGLHIDGGKLVWASAQEIYTYDLNAPVPSVIQITNNSVSDVSPIIGDGVVVWLGNDGNDFEIYYYDLNATSPAKINITNDSVNNLPPIAIDSNIVVWIDNDGTDYEVYYYDLAAVSPTAVRLTDNLYRDTSPATDNGVIAWRAFVSSKQEIYFLDLNATVPTTVRVSSTVEVGNPDIDNGIITMIGYDGNDDEIYYYDINAAAPTLVKISDNTWDDQYPYIGNGLIVWECDYEICYYDLNSTSPSVLQATNNQLLISYGQYDCDSQGGVLIWEDEFVWAMRP